MTKKKEVSSISQEEADKNLAAAKKRDMGTKR